MITKKQLQLAIRCQDSSNDIGFNDNWNVHVYGTTRSAMALVDAARWDYSGFQKKRITMKILMNYLNAQGITVQS